MMGIRKSIWVMLGTIIGVLALAVIFEGIDNQTDVVRYHQHLEQPSEAELGACSVCGGKAELCTHLPIISIETGGQKIPGRSIADKQGNLIGYETGDHGESDILVNFSTVAQDGDWHHLDDSPDVIGQAVLHIRGNSSRHFSKSNYRLNLVEKDGVQEKKHSLMGMTASSEWALHGPFLDKTLLRNYLCMNIAAEIMGYAPNVRFCELMLDGKYQGVYVLMETISVQEGRVNLTKYRDGDPVTSYLVRIQGADPLKMLDNFTSYSYRLEEGHDVELLYPGLSRQTLQIKNYVQTDFSEIEKLLYSGEMETGSKAWQTMVDMRSFVDYYIIMEFFAVNDVFSNSTYFYRDARGKLTAGPVWDFNNALDNFFMSMPKDEFLLSQRGWFAQLMKDEDFVEAVIDRYRELRQGVLSEASLTAYVRQTEEWLGSAVDRNYEVWGYSFDTTQLSNFERRYLVVGSDQGVEEVNPSSYAEAMDWMLTYMSERGQWMDSQIESLRQYCHPSKKAAQTW